MAKMPHVKNKSPSFMLLWVYSGPSDLVAARQRLGWAYLGHTLPFSLWAYPLPLAPPLVPASLDGFYNGRSLDGEPPCQGPGT